MSYPSARGPWFVVQRMATDGTVSGDYVGMEYYTNQEEGGAMYQKDKKVAMIFVVLEHAARVAGAEGAEVRVLTSQEEADEFGRG